MDIKHFEELSEIEISSIDGGFSTTLGTSLGYLFGAALNPKEWSKKVIVGNPIPISLRF